MRLLITGAAGYLGAALARRCAAAGAEVVGLDVSDRPPAWPAEALFEHGDVTAETTASRIVGHRPEIVAHLAWIFDPTHSWRRERAVDIEGTKNVFRAAAAVGARRIVYPSSTTSYGIDPRRTDPYTEDDRPVPNPKYRYAYSKARVEEWLPGFRARHPAIDLVVLRACVVLGPGTANIVTRLTGWPVMPRVAGHNPPLQFLHEQDAVDALWWALTRANPGTYNVAGHGLMRYSDVCKAAGRPAVSVPSTLLRALTAIGWTLRLCPVPPGFLDYIRYPWIADTSRLLERTDFRPRYGTRDALAAYLEAAQR